MGHCVQAIVGTKHVLDRLHTRFGNSRVVEQAQGLFILPLTEGFYDAVPGGDDPARSEESKFLFLTPKIIALLIEASTNDALAYIETDYFGGAGDQGAVVIKYGQIMFGPITGDGSINSALRLLGVKRSLLSDEFAAVGLDRFRRNEDWLDQGCGSEAEPNDTAGAVGFDGHTDGPLIFFDVTSARGARHLSGLLRVSERLRTALGDRVREVFWKRGEWRLVDGAREVWCPAATDWLLTAEVFSEIERPGVTAFFEKPPLRTAAIFHDLIPLRHPDITWPQSVARHPLYLELLARCDRVLAVSQASADDLAAYWKWQGRTPRGTLNAITLGADFDGSARRAIAGAADEWAGMGPAKLLCVGILEPRKNQTFLLGVIDALNASGCACELHVVGRVNPVFGKPIEAALKAAAKRRGSTVRWHGAVDDETLAALYAEATATVFPTIAEGCGLPLLESLWRGVPCVASDLPSLRENAAGGGCVLLPVNDHAAWVRGLGALLRDDAAGQAERARLRAEAATRALPRWSDTAAQVVSALS